MQIEGKVALITGASEGIGAALARMLAARGASLSLVARREPLLKEVGGPDAVATAGDLLDSATRRLAVERTLERFGRIDILVNNAGIGLYAPSWRASMEEIRRLFELNVFAAIEMTQLAVPSMRARRCGMVVNVGSIGGKVTLPWFTLYSATKYALGSLTDGLRMELRRDGIHALMVCPGYVITRFQENVLGGEPPEKLKKMRRYRITAETCAAAIVRGIEREARVVVTPRAGWLFVVAARLLPGVVDGQMESIYRQVAEG